jgi:type II secretory pathway component GspD/PulD (secretin)
MRTKPLILLAICALTTLLLAGALFAAEKKGATATPTPRRTTPGRVDIIPPPATPAAPVTPRPTPTVPVTPRPTPALPVTPPPTPAVKSAPPTPVAKKPAPASAQESPAPMPAPAPKRPEPAPGPAPAAAPVSPAPTPSPAAVPSPSDDTTPGPVSEGAGEAAKPGDEKTASVLYPNPVPIGVLIDDVKDQTGVKIVLCGKSSALKIPYSGSDLTAEAFLNSISGANKLRWRKVPDGYELWDEDSYNNEVTPKLVRQKVFLPVYVSAKYLYEAIKGSNVLTPKVGNVAVDERTNKVMVADLPEKLALVQDMVNLLDEPQFTRVFYVRYAVIKDVVEKIKQFKSEAGTIESDEIAHLIIVRDIMANIQRMETMIDLLDVRQIGRVYNLNSIGIDAKEVDKLQKNLELLITKSAFLMIDEARGLLILRDTPEVQEDVEKFLQVFDRPIDQVRIEAELLDVDQNSVFSYGMEYAVSGDLPSAVADGLIENFGKGSATDNPFGFVNYKNEFPLGKVGSAGITASYLSSRLKAQLTALMSDTNTEIVSQPRVTVKNREQVKLVDTKSVPITNISYGTSYYSSTSAGTASNPMVSTTAATGGLTIDITPTISPTGLVEMKIYIENSTVEPVSIESGISGQKVQAVNSATDSIDTVLIIPDGETRVISGLIHRVQGDTKAGVPYLMKIPVIGSFLFGKTDKKERVRNLLFFVTPTILREQAKGKLVAYEFDQLPAQNKWESSEIPAEVKEGQGGPALEDLTTTGTQRPRFYAPTPDEFRNKLEEGKTTITLPIPLPIGKVDNSPEGLARALRAGGGALPDFAQDQKTGFSGEFKTPAASPAGPPAAPGGAQPGVTPPPPAAKPPVAAGPPAPTPPGARPGSGASGAEAGGPRLPRVTPIPVLEPVIPPPLAPAQPETKY